MTFTIENLTERDIAKTIDHSLLRPELDDAFVEAGCRLAAKYDVASVCVRPADVARAKAIPVPCSPAICMAASSARYPTSGPTPLSPSTRAMVGATRSTRMPGRALMPPRSSRSP